ncbi:carbohydrate-binding module family 1 protein [Gonapodya prolifera JEL478]|uniref:Carbohydrate-binding module family 1 protein n=1 Tax=Gonapodya prolifera (strain JEL478) TaxID=1344416 RepID=A0A138ZXY1_GONPJ|nr:carbohydrate-binding module family 1 protein [Gonapodya prolifera JEL478]|eukprot:KXS08993.1 carbohydrate-binding module family 1 protein [Gonapodya prolifera JEL478]
MRFPTLQLVVCLLLLGITFTARAQNVAIAAGTELHALNFMQEDTAPSPIVGLPLPSPGRTTSDPVLTPQLPSSPPPPVTNLPPGPPSPSPPSIPPPTPAPSPAPPPPPVISPPPTPPPPPPTPLPPPAPPSPAPIPVPPPSPPSSSCAAVYQQCGGQTYTGPRCCQTGSCVVQNAYYSQCLQTSTNSGCVGNYGQCGGNGYSGPSCCQAGYSCRVQNPYYSQCVPV